MSSNQSRFDHVFNDNDIVEFVESAKPQNTKRHEDWAVKLWSDWAQHRVSNNSVESTGLPSSLDLLVSKDDINDWVTKFILEIRNVEGKEYTPTSIKCITAALYRYIKARGYNGPSFLSKDSPVCSVIDAKLKKLKSAGVGLQVKRADCIQINDEEKLWECKVLNMETSHGLLNAVFFYNGKILALRGRSEHKDLQIEQFQFKVDTDNKPFVEFWPMVRKNAQGTVSHSKIRSEAIKQYDTIASNSYYKLIKLYLSKLPVDSGAFYRRPITGKIEPRYSIQAVGINTIGGLLKKIFNEAGIKDDRNISNHGLRATAATTLFEAGFSQRTISVRTGHISTAVNNYIRDSKTTHLAVSRCLEPINIDSKSNDVLSSSEQNNMNVSTKVDKIGEVDEIGEVDKIDVVGNNDVDHQDFYEKTDFDYENDREEELNLKQKYNLIERCGSNRLEHHKSESESDEFGYDGHQKEANERPIILEFRRGTKKLKITM